MGPGIARLCGQTDPQEHHDLEEIAEPNEQSSAVVDEPQYSDERRSRIT